MAPELSSGAPRETESQRQRGRQRQRQTDRERYRDTERERETDGEKKTETERESQTRRNYMHESVTLVSKQRQNFKVIMIIPHTQNCLLITSLMYFVTDGLQIYFFKSRNHLLKSSFFHVAEFGSCRNCEFYFENRLDVHSVWLCVTACARGRACARGTVGVCECVLVRGRAKKTCTGVGSGVTPALFKTTCQRGIRPGLLRWRPRSSVGFLPPRSSLGFHCCLNSESEDFFLQGGKL